MRMFSSPKSEEATEPDEDRGEEDGGERMDVMKDDEDGAMMNGVGGDNGVERVNN